MYIHEIHAEYIRNWKGEARIYEHTGGNSHGRTEGVTKNFY
jgi:hypothetical protein